MVLRGGENVFPREVEEFPYTVPGVADVHVIGVPDAKYGEELRAFCKGKIATYKIPRYWKFVDGFPMTVSGKVQKFKMREQAVKELHLEAAASIRTAQGAGRGCHPAPLRRAASGFLRVAGGWPVPAWARHRAFSGVASTHAWCALATRGARGDPGSASMG